MSKPPHTAQRRPKINESDKPQRGAIGRLRGLAIDTEPLKHRAFRRLWLGQGVSYIGFTVTSVAVPVQVYALTRSSLWVGVLSLAGLIPLVIFGLWGGAIADHVDRRKLLIGASFIAWAATLLLIVQSVLHLRSVAVIMVAVVIQAGGFAITSPTRSAIIPRLLHKDQVSAANTLNFTASQVSTLAGPLLAAFLLPPRFDYSVAYGLDAVLFTVGLYASFRLPPIPPLEARQGTPGLRSVLEGLRFLGTEPVLLMSFVVDIIAMGIAMPRALFPQMAAERFGGNWAVGWMFAAISIGSLLGGLVSGWIGRVRRQGVALVCCIVVWGLAVAAAGLSHRLWLVVALLAVGGAADLVSAVFRQTMLQTYAPDEMRGRLQGVFVVVVAGGPRLGDLRAGAVASVAGAGFAWVSGGLACAVLVVVAALAVPALLRYDTHMAPGEQVASG